MHRSQEATEECNSSSSEDILPSGAQSITTGPGKRAFRSCRSWSGASSRDYKYKPRILRHSYGVPGPKVPIRGYLLNKPQGQFCVEMRKQVYLSCCRNN